jgi:hypothetical protein
VRKKEGGKNKERQQPGARAKSETVGMSVAVTVSETVTRAVR